MSKLKQYLITGFVVVVPVFLTIYVLVVIFRFADGILGKFVNIYLKGVVGFYIPGIGFLLSFLIILFVGFLAKRFFIHKIFSPIERWFSGLPLISNIYPAFKQIILFISAQKEFGFKKVALVEYPSKGMWSIGFVTNEQFPEVNQACKSEMLAVFLPTTPGPFSGYVVFFPKEAVKYPDISISDALKVIISGGVLKPGSASSSTL